MPFSLQPTPDATLDIRQTAAAQASIAPATSILELESGIAWRKYLRPAMFRGARFHVDTGVRESGRRVVQHEFPKRNVPYGEDMGRRAREFTVRGYIIVYPRDGDSDLQKRNYIPARDRLIAALEEDGAADLQLPLLGVLNVLCTRYRITEEEKFGGYCVFDMSFFEFGQAPATGTRDSAAGVYYAADNFNSAVQSAIESAIKDEGGANPPASEDISA